MVEAKPRKKAVVKIVESFSIGNPSELCVQALQKEKSDAKNTLKRFYPEYKPTDLPVSYKLRKEGLADILQLWDVTFKGRAGTPYEGRKITGTLQFPDNYPIDSPRFIFGTLPDDDKQHFKHINVYGDGSTCIDILNAATYNSATQVADMLKALEDLIYNPNPDSAANKELEGLFRKDMASYEQRIKEQAERLPKA